MMLIIDMKKYHSLKPKTHGINIAAGLVLLGNQANLANHMV